MGMSMTRANQATQPDFTEFHRLHHQRLVRALAMTTGDADIANEAIDEAMARAAERWTSIGDYSSPEGWVYRVALNWARSVFRRRHPLPKTTEAVWDALPDPDVVRAVASLPHRQRVVVVAHYYLDWSTSQIAAYLDIPEGTVKSRLHRSLDRLADELGGSQ